MSLSPNLDNNTQTNHSSCSNFEQIEKELDQFLLVNEIKNKFKIEKSLELMDKSAVKSDNSNTVNNAAHSSSNSTSSSSNESNKITRNEAYFADEANKNSILDLSESCNNYNNNKDKITYENENLYNTLFKNNEKDDHLNDVNNTNNPKNPPQPPGPSFKLPPLSSAISRDGFVTNQRYQLLKENKRSESQITHCYDEVFNVKEDEEDVNDNDESEDDDNRSVSSSSSSDSSASSSSTSSSSSSSSSSSTTSSATSSLSIKSLTKTSIKNNKDVVLNMYSSDNEENEEKNSKYKKKFDSLVEQKEYEKLLKISGNKYEEEEKLLKVYENECKYGSNFTTKQQPLNSQIRSKAALDLINNSSKKSSIVERQMKNDFTKNEDENDELDEDETKPNSTTAVAATIATNTTSSDVSDVLLNDVLRKLVSKQSSKQSSTTSTSTTTNPLNSASSSLQFNNYKTSVDDYMNFNLKHNKKEHTDNNNVVTNNNKSLSSCSSSSSSTSANLPSNNARGSGLVLDGNQLDSHGSSLTNSSKQDDLDEYDMEIDEQQTTSTNNNTNDNQKYAIESDINKSYKYNFKTNSTTSLNSNKISGSGGGGGGGGCSLHDTIIELGQNLVEKNLNEKNKTATSSVVGSGFKSSLIAQNNINSANHAYAMRANSNLSGSSTNTGLFHQK